MKTTPLSRILFFILIYFILHTSFVLNPGIAYESRGCHDAASIMAFANNLSHHGHHFKAVMEYQRFIYFFPNHPDIPKARYKMACSMKSGANYTPAIKLFSSLAKEYKGSPPGIEASFQGAEVLYLMHDYQSALKHYATFLFLYPEHPMAQQAKQSINEIKNLLNR